MNVVTAQISIDTKGFGSMHDVTSQVNREITESGLEKGTVTVFVAGSTASVTTIEFESGAVGDFQDAIARAAPENIRYKHNDRWGDGNGFSHVRAAWLGPSLTVPFVNKTMMLGTWQQLVVVDFDNGPRHRNIILQFVGI
jgi:secondary thiamine-phosphate synthase enzyme